MERNASLDVYFFRPPTASQLLIPNQYTSTDTNDSIASSYCPSEQRKHHNFSQPNDPIAKLQQQNFQRLLSNAEYTPSTNKNYSPKYPIEDNNHTDTQRTVLNHRKQILLNALQNIDQQIEELDIQ
jgi:hypothetical protein